MSLFLSFAAKAVSIGGALWNDKNRNGTVEIGEEVIQKWLYVSAVHNGIVLDCVQTEFAMGFGVGKYYIANLPENTSGVSLVLSTNSVMPGAPESSLIKGVPTGYIHTYANIGGFPGSATAGTALPTSHTIPDITLGTVQMNNYNFGLLQLPVATTVNYLLPSPPLAGKVFAFTGGSELPAIGNGTTVSSLKITQLPTNGAELYYDSGAGPELISLDQEIPEFDVNKLTIKTTNPSYNTTSFQYAFRDNGGVLGSPATYTIDWTSPLPVKLTRFTAAKENLNALLSWSTSSEGNSDRFEIEHSVDGKKWNNIGSVSASNTSSPVDYSFSHLATVHGENIYRLKMIDLDDSFSFSQMKNLYFETVHKVISYPNPASERLRINSSDIVDIKFYDLTGRLALSPAINQEEVDVKDLTQGNYILQVTQKNGSTLKTKVLIRR